MTTCRSRCCLQTAQGKRTTGTFPSILDQAHMLLVLKWQYERLRSSFQAYRLQWEGQG